MNWCAISVPPSVSALLADCQLRRYSQAQALAALLDCFARLPLSDRVHLAEEYLQQGPSPAAAAGTTATEAAHS
jgi:hypothetical protein